MSRFNVMPRLEENTRRMSDRNRFWIPPREAQAFKMRSERRTYQEIATELDCTKERAKQLVDHAMRRLAAQLPSEQPSVTTMTAPKPCALCGRDPANGYAGIDDRFYCHGDDDSDPTCFMQAQQLLARIEVAT